MNTTTSGHKKGKQIADSGLEMMAISNDFNPLLNELPMKIFYRYQELLLNKPLPYIVPAVWGADRHQTLSKEQQAIHAEIAPEIETAILSFGVDRLTDVQIFALRYLLCGLFIHKMLFMIEGVKNLGMGDDAQKQILLKNVGAWGSA